MNIKLLSLMAVPLVMSGCDFNEDFCIRNGELIAYCKFDEAELPPVYEYRHIRGYGETIDTLKTNFTQDTLRWKIPQGKYVFIFYTGNYTVNNSNNYHESLLTVETDTIDNVVRIAGEPVKCYSSLFNAELKYQQPVKQEITPATFTQQLNIKLVLSGNVKPIAKISGNITGAATGKYLVSHDKTGCADIGCLFKKTDNTTWTTSIHTFGFIPTADNMLTLDVSMNDENSIFDESKSIDLSAYLKDFNESERSLEIKIGVGSEITIEDPVIIPDWEDNPEIVLP